MPITRSSSLRARLALWVPRWWAGDAGSKGKMLDLLLAPGEAGYRGVMAARNVAFDRGWLKTEGVALPVISVGNITVGGAGKTPFAAWLARELDSGGCRPGVVLRGYGRDEVLVHQRLNPRVPVFADPRRVRAVREAERAGCRVAVLDDAFQHRSLSRDLDLLLISAESWAGPRRLLPRGPWRESLDACRRADVLVVTSKSASDEEAAAVRADLEVIAPHRPVVHCRIRATQLLTLHSDEVVVPARLADERVLAIAALADPGPFVKNLEAMGARVELLAYPDHHEFTSEDAAALSARAAGRRIVMTLKDAVKLRDLLPTELPAAVLHQEVVIDSGAMVLQESLQRVVQGRCG